MISINSYHQKWQNPRALAWRENTPKLLLPVLHQMQLSGVKLSLETQVKVGLVPPLLPKVRILNRIKTKYRRYLQMGWRSYMMITWVSMTRETLFRLYRPIGPEPGPNQFLLPSLVHVVHPIAFIPIMADRWGGRTQTAPIFARSPELGITTKKKDMVAKSTMMDHLNSPWSVSRFVVSLLYFGE